MICKKISFSGDCPGSAFLGIVAPVPARESILRNGNLLLDLEHSRARVGRKMVSLTATELNLLTQFLQNQGQVLTRKRLLSKVWGASYQGTARTVDTHIQRLRSKLGPARTRIRTVRGRGYRLD